MRILHQMFVEEARANNLCSYQHPTKENKSDHFIFQQCDIILKTNNLFLEHAESIHVEEEKIHRDHLFPLKCPNCPMWI